MQAERKRRQLSIGPTACGAPAKPAELTVVSRIEAEQVLSGRCGAYSENVADGEARVMRSADLGLPSRMEAGQKTAEAEAAAAVASHRGMAPAPSGIRPAKAEPETAEDMATAWSRPPRTWAGLLVATTAALMTGIGAGYWLGKPPAVSVRSWAEGPAVLRLRLDHKLMSPLQEQHTMPRHRSP
jgi:hypothetical protein